MSEPLSRTIEVTNKQGIHTRPSTLVAKKASEFEADIHISRGERKADAKSVMQVVMLAATRGTELEVTASGPDAEVALEVISKLLVSDFEEAYRKPG